MSGGPDRIAARLSGNGKVVLCGECSEVLAQRVEYPLGQHFLVFAPEWRNDVPGKVYRGPKIKRGWARVITGAMRKPPKSFQLDLPAECPSCRFLNDLRHVGAIALDG